MVKYSELLDDVYGALAHPSRRRMIERLGRGPCSVSALAEDLPIAMPAVMKHLAALEGAGLVHSGKQGRVRTCELDPAGLDPAQRWIEQQRRQWTASLDRLTRHLEEHP